MVFSSTLFLFLFLPVVLAAHFVLPRVCRNGLLLAASLFFYAWGETFYVAVMLFSIAVNYGFGLAIERFRGLQSGRIALGLAIAVNLAMLATFKYANFLVDSVNGVLSPIGFDSIELRPVHLPIGISFFTFQAMSYVIDVSRDHARAQRNPFYVALYIALFPQLIAGPIVRYGSIAGQLVHRTITRDGFAYGIQRFTIGLAKKVLIANTLARPADEVFAIPSGELTVGLAWLGAVCYTLQIYFDFSGYSDMAIGLGRMIGFQFPENFRYPYAARSVRDFWRRWHISLSTWFRDYLYLPLGGSRGGAIRTYRNLVIVFFLCGLWHGASWTFVVWGLFHGFFLVLERVAPSPRSIPVLFRHAATMLVVTAGWVIFRSETLAQAWWHWAAMVGMAQGDSALHPFALYWGNDIGLALVAGIAGSLPVGAAVLELHRRAGTSTAGEAAFQLGRVCVLAALMVASAVALSAQTHNPFIYFRF